jgi:hypothetical protein
VSVRIIQPELIVEICCGPYFLKVNALDITDSSINELSSLFAPFLEHCHRDLLPLRQVLLLLSGRGTTQQSSRCKDSGDRVFE